MSRLKYSFIYLLLVFLVDLQAYRRDAKQEFSTFTYVTPRLEDYAGSSLSLKAELPEKFKIVVTPSLVLRANLVTELMLATYFEKYHVNGSTVMGTPNLQKCHFQGEVEGKPGSWMALSGCDGQLSGMIVTTDETYYLHPEKNGPTLLFQHSDRHPQNTICGNEDDHSDIKRVRRSAALMYDVNPRTRYLELIIVNDYREFVRLEHNEEAVLRRTKAIANILNALYRPFNIFIVLVGIVVWTEQDDIVSSNANSSLTKFLKYRTRELNPRHPNDNAQLISGITFDRSVVGKALKGQICTQQFSGGVNSDHSDIIGIVASTLAHEMGHNFGMEHDNQTCRCSSEKCIMSVTSGSESIREWSSCSVEAIHNTFKWGMDHCLWDVPKANLFPMCGNGILDPGEECDCGLPEFCISQCCNSTTCTLLEHAECGTGSCCDLDSCQLKEAGTTCRPSTHPECDLPEFCTGKSEKCPDDTFTQFGVLCGDKNAYCYEGKCRSHASQCSLLWGATGKLAHWRCYSLNSIGNMSGNCGYNYSTETYVSCQPKDELCGRLHCVHWTDKLQYGSLVASIESTTNIWASRRDQTTCQTARIDLGTSPDPGLVPDGASCGHNMMCVSNRCQPLSTARTKDCDYNCYDNGICNNKGNCHCNPGFAPPYCNYPGPGGSVDSGPAANLEVGEKAVVVILILFMGIVPLCIIIGCVGFRYRHLLTGCFKRAATPRPHSYPKVHVRENPLDQRHQANGLVSKPVRPAPPAPMVVKLPARTAPPLPPKPAPPPIPTKPPVGAPPSVSYTRAAFPPDLPRA